MIMEIPLPNCVDNLHDVLSFGRMYGHFWLTSHLGGGYIAGYLRVIENHPWYMLSAIDNDVFFEQHAGIDWAGKDKHLYPDWAEGWWLGFNCNHECDWPDKSVAYDFGCKVKDSCRKSWQVVRTLDYAEQVLISFAQEACAAVVTQKRRKRKNG